MKLQVGSGKQVYGTVETTPDGLQYDGEDVDIVKNIVESARQPKETDAALLARLPEQLNGRVWARNPAVRMKPPPSGKIKPRQPPGLPTWKEHPDLPPDVLEYLKSPRGGKI